MPIHSKTFLNLIDKDAAQPAPCKLHDGEGLYLIVGQGMARSWLYRFTFDGKPDSVNLGPAKNLDLKAARAARDAAAEQVKDKVNPRLARKAAKAGRKAPAAPVKRKTVYEIALEMANNPKCKKGPTDPKRRVHWANQLQGKLTAGLGDKAPVDVTRDDVVACLQAICDRTEKKHGQLMGEQARKVLVQLDQLFEHCAGAGGYLSLEAVNPAKFKGRLESLIEFLPERRYVSHAAIKWQDIGPVAAAIRAKGSIVALALEWTLISAARVGMTINADWSQIDLSKNYWTIPAPMMKESEHGDHVVPLTARHLEILAKLAPEGFPASGLIFPAERADLIGVSLLQDTLRAAYPDMIRRKDGSHRQAAVHGLRSAFRTWGEQQMKGKERRYNREDLELCLAHVVGDSAERAYIDEANIEIRRNILTDWTKFLAKTVTTLARAA